MELSASKLEALRRNLQSARLAAEQLGDGGRSEADQRAALAALITALDQAADLVGTSTAARTYANESAGSVKDVIEEDDTSNSERLSARAEGSDLFAPMITQEERDAVDDALQEPEEPDQSDDESLVV
jgi:hypothetical protein